MARILLTVSSDLFDDSENQEASVRENLPVRTLLAEIRKEFNLSEGTYVLRNASTNKPLELEKTLEQCGIQTGSAISVTRERKVAPMMQSAPSGAIRRTAALGSRIPIEGPPAFLQAESGQLFELQWQPAIIGRPDLNNPASAETLAVNLGNFEDARSVSRNHGAITESDGQYFLENLAKQNPLYLNESEVRSGEKRFLQPGDKIRLGKIILVFGIRN